MDADGSGAVREGRVEARRRGVERVRGEETALGMDGAERAVQVVVWLLAPGDWDCPSIPSSDGVRVFLPVTPGAVSLPRTLSTPPRLVSIRPLRPTPALPRPSPPRLLATLPPFTFILFHFSCQYTTLFLLYLWRNQALPAVVPSAE